LTEEEGSMPTTAKEGEYILTQEEMARIWHAAMTDWLRDRQKGYRKNEEK
jgi:hypothetical protein